jgi:transposase
VRLALSVEAYAALARATHLKRNQIPRAAELAATASTAAGLAPVPRDSGRRTGNLHRPQRYNRTMQRVFYVSAMSVIGRPGASQDYYQRKRAEGKRHIQAVMALSRRRVNVLWATLRDNKPYAFTPQPTPAAA